MAPPLLLPSPPPPPSTETLQDRHLPPPSPSPSKQHIFHFDASGLNSILQSLPSHPFLKPLFSLHSQYQTFVQAHLRIPRNQQRQMSALSSCNFAAILPGDSVAGLVVANGLNNFLNIYNTLLVVRLVLTWFPNSPPAIVSPLSTICDPYLNVFRGLIPPLGGLDLSPILAFLVLNAFTSTAAALPAELPASQNPTTMQEKWTRRLASRFAKN